MSMNFVIPQEYFIASRVKKTEAVEVPVVEKGKRNGKRSRR